MGEVQAINSLVIPGQQLKNWTDLWFSEDKKAGYVAITDFKKQLFYGSNDVARIVSETEGREKQFISINAFEVDWKKGEFSRTTAALKQIRIVAIDIDQYNLGLTIEQALDQIQALITSNVIPEPNLVLTSRGIQIFYSIKQGASPKMSWLVSYITEQFISKMKAVGADSNAKDMSRVMRVPNSVNERNGATVTPTIWNDAPYSLQELQAYCRPLEKFETRRKKKNNIVQFPISKGLELFYKTNYARLTDFKRIIELRQGDFTGMRNVLLYMVSYHQSLILNIKIDVIESVRAFFSEVHSRTDNPMTEREFQRTVRSAYDDAREFFNHFVTNGYRIVHRANDGIKKPYKTSSMIEKLNITESEQYEMRTIRNADVARIQDKERKRSARRSEGIMTRQEYKDSMKRKQSERVAELNALLERHPNATNSALARLIGMSTSTIKRLKRLTL